MGEQLDSLPLLERMLRCELPEAHELISHILWDAANDLEAVEQLKSLADSNIEAWELALRTSGDRSDRGSRSDDRSNG